jgi:hypothetical protein
MDPRKSIPLINKSFLFLFFKKELLPFVVDLAALDLAGCSASVATRQTFFGPPQPDRFAKAKGSISSSAAGIWQPALGTGTLGISAARA